MVQCDIARQRIPNDGLLLTITGAIQRRQGELDLALTSFQRAHELNLLMSLSAKPLAETHSLLRDYARAASYCDRAIQLSPDQPRPYARKLQILLSRGGSSPEARRVGSEAMAKVDYAEQ